MNANKIKLKNHPWMMLKTIFIRYLRCIASGCTSNGLGERTYRRNSLHGLTEGKQTLTAAKLYSLKIIIKAGSK